MYQASFSLCLSLCMRALTGRMSIKHAVVRARCFSMLQHAITRCFKMLSLCNILQLHVSMPLICLLASYMCGSHASRRMLKLRVYERRGEGMRIWVRKTCCGLYMGARGLLRLVYACGLFRRSHAACILMRRGWWRWGLEGRGWARG